MHDPAKNNVIVSGTTKKAVQQITDIAHDHILCFFCYLKRIGIPTPVTVQKNTVGQIFFQLLADCCFANLSFNYVLRLQSQKAPSARQCLR